MLPMESQRPDKQGKGEVAIRDLVRASLRLRPDRIVVGECRGGEALDMLQAMNTGHSGSMTTLHANSSKDALSRLETMAVMSGVEMPLSAVRAQVASAVEMIVQIARFPGRQPAADRAGRSHGPGLQGRLSGQPLVFL